MSLYIEIAVSSFVAGPNPIIFSCVVILEFALKVQLLVNHERMSIWIENIVKSV